MNQANAPIGIFDSGLGGLTVAHAIREALPHESFIYIGDTAHLPYGDKSPEVITQYSHQLAEILLCKGCKAIVVACNSASSAAFASLRAKYHDKLLIVDVISPVIAHIKAHYHNTALGLIGTSQTIRSGAYQEAIHRLTSNNLELIARATPVLTPVIEDGLVDANDILGPLLNHYLPKDEFASCRGLILGCTHYPLLKPALEKHFDGDIALIDSAGCVAKSLKAKLAELNLLSDKPVGNSEFYVTDYTEQFASMAQKVFQEAHQLTLLSLDTAA